MIIKNPLNDAVIRLICAVPPEYLISIRILQFQITSLSNGKGFVYTGMPYKGIFRYTARYSICLTVYRKICI